MADCSDAGASGSPLFAPAHISFFTFDGLPDAAASPPPPPRIFSCSDPLQCFLPSPFSFTSLSALLPARAAATACNSRPSASAAWCLASVSAAESIKRQSSVYRAESLNLSSALRFVLRGNRSNANTQFEILDDEKTDAAGPSLECGDSVSGSHALTTSKHLLAGALSAVISRTIVAPLERLKLEYIVRGATSDVVDVVKMIVSSEGVKGFWKGNLVNLIRTAPFKSINFYAYDSIRKRITTISGRKDITNQEKLAAGAAAGIFATIICFPMDTIRTRMVAPGGEALGGIAACCRHLVSSQGLSSLYAGIVPAIISMAPAGAVFYGVYDILKTGYLESPAGQAEVKKRLTSGKRAGEQMELGPLRTLLYGAIAGACAETVTYPLEVVRRHLQLQDAAQRLGLIRTVQGLVQEKGVAALYAGILPSTLQVLPSAALSYFVYEWLKLSMKVS